MKTKYVPYAKQKRQVNRLFKNQTKRTRLLIKAYSNKQIKKIQTMDDIPQSVKDRLVKGLAPYTTGKTK